MQNANATMHNANANMQNATGNMHPGHAHVHAPGQGPMPGMHNPQHGNHMHGNSMPIDPRRPQGLVRNDAPAPVSGVGGGSNAPNSQSMKRKPDAPPRVWTSALALAGCELSVCHPADMLSS